MHSVSAQKQANHWYFGNYAGLDFSSGSPVADNNGQLHNTTSNVEGSASISDSSGALLFYSDGEVIYNASHSIMLNGSGLLGGQSSSQSAAIVPMPGDFNKYYLITTDDFINNLDNGLNYSIVDMCLDNGLGGVMNGFKNIHLLDTASEKLAVCRHANGTDYWIVTQKHFTNEFYSFQVTASGINPPVMSAVGPVHGDGTAASSIGQMKISPDGTSVALVDGQGQTPFAEILDFDNNTGILSNPDTLLSVTYPGPFVFKFGVSFSPNSQLVYFAVCNYDQGIRQVDVATRTILYNIPVSVSTNMMGMQLAPDGKIYCVNGSAYDSISVINDPDQVGAACDFQLNILSLNGGVVTFSFPGFIDNFDYPATIPVCGIPDAVFNAMETDICPGTCNSFQNLSTNTTSSYWLFPGASPDTSTATNPSNICYATPGSYDVILIASNAIGTDTLLLSNYITVYPQPLPQSIMQNGDTLFAIAGSATYQWYFNGSIINGATDYFYVAPQSGDYNVVATDANGCEVEAVINNVLATVGSNCRQSIQIYPNPVNTVIGIRGLKNNYADEIRIFNVYGELVFMDSRCQLPITIPIAISSPIPAGIYYLVVSEEEKIFRVKFVKQ